MIIDHYVKTHIRVSNKNLIRQHDLITLDRVIELIGRSKLIDEVKEKILAKPGKLAN